MSIKFTNPSVLLGYGRGVRLPSVSIAEGPDDETRFDVEDYDIEVILTPKFKPGWYEDITTREPERRFRWFKEDPDNHGWRRASVDWPEPKKEN
jgi:hypothetical protein